MSTTDFPSQAQAQAHAHRGNAAPSDKPIEHWLFMGNPGVGKSTLINCLVGEPVFESGVHYGSGMTTFLQREQRGNIVFMDTPGLADTKLRQQAADAITEALKEGNGLYKLFFVVTLQQGRAKPDDIATVHKVLESVDVPDIKFCIVVNQVKPRQFRELQKLGEAYQNVVQSISSGRFQTPFIFFAPEMEELDEVDGAVIAVPPDFRVFLEDTAPTLHIPSVKVKEIDTNAGHFDDEVRRLEDLVSQLLADKTRQQEEWKAFYQLHQQQLQEAQAAQQRLVEQMMEQQRRNEEARRDEMRRMDERNDRMMHQLLKQSAKAQAAPAAPAPAPAPSRSPAQSQQKKKNGCTIL